MGHGRFREVCVFKYFQCTAYRNGGIRCDRIGGTRVFTGHAHKAHLVHFHLVDAFLVNQGSGRKQDALEAVAHGLQDAFVEAVWNAHTEDIPQLDLFAIGTGVYLGKPSGEIIRFIDALPEGNGKPG